MENLIPYILTALAVLITLTIHEFCHGYAAYKLGDNTAKLMGRLTLNPLAHLDLVGAICLLLFRFGWAKPVPINPRNFKKPRRDFALCALAGPLANILASILSAFMLLVCIKVFTILAPNGFWYAFCNNLIDFIYIFHLVNIGLAIFNLIPVPPLDGSRVLNAVLPVRLYFKLMKYERISYYVLIVWLLFGTFLKKGVLMIPLVSNNAVLKSLTSILSLSEIIGFIIEMISEWMIGLLSLIPFI